METNSEKGTERSQKHQGRHRGRGGIMGRGGSLADRVEDEIASFVEDADLSKITAWISRNPKLAVGGALVAGLLVGAFANGRLGRTAIVGIASLVGRRFV